MSSRRQAGGTREIPLSQHPISPPSTVLSTPPSVSEESLPIARAEQSANLRRTVREPEASTSQIMAVPPRPSQYRLRMLQQPIRAAAAGTDMQVLDRIPIVPSPVAELMVEDESGRLHYATYHPDMQYLIAFAVLTDQSNPTGIESVEDEVSGEERQAIIGQTVANLVMFTDVDGQRKAVFSFGDLSVRAEGNFRLKLTLAQALPGASTLASVITDAFDCVSPSRLSGGSDLASTSLSRHLRNQGVSVYLGAVSS